MKDTNPTDFEPANRGMSSTITTIADVVANGIPIGKNARLVAKVEDLNHGEYKAKPAAVVGISFSF